MKLLRFIAAIILGCVALGATVFALEALGHAIYPPTPEFKAAMDATMSAYASGEPQQIDAARTQAAAAIAGLPLGAILMVVGSWIAGAFVGGGVAALVAPYGRLIAALIVTALDLGAVAANLVMIPHPAWTGPVAIAGCLVAGVSVGLCVRSWRASRAPTPGSRTAGAA